MKKLLALLLSLLMATSLCIFAGCEIVFVTDDSSSDSSSNSSNNSSDDSTSTSEDAGKVDLIGISASVNTEVKAQSTQKTSALSLTTSYTNLSVKPMHNDDELLDNVDYLAIFKDQTIINFTIKLNNPYDYYIMDFRLVADDEEVEYYTSEKTWKPIKDRDIRWMGSDNETYTYILKLPTPEATPSNIRIKWMYYSDKHDGRNKFAVNLNNRDRYTIYKVDSEVKTTSVKLVDIKNPLDGIDADGNEVPIKFRLELEEGTTIDRLYTWNFLDYDYRDIEITEDNIYELDRWKNGSLYIEYSCTKGNVTIKTSRKIPTNYFQIIYRGGTGIKVYEEFGNKQYFYVGLNLQGSGCPRWRKDEGSLEFKNGSSSFTYNGNNFIIVWNDVHSDDTYLLLEIPEGKDEAWCREQEIELVGNVFNIGKLVDMEYGKFAG